MRCFNAIKHSAIAVLWLTCLLGCGERRIPQDTNQIVSLLEGAANSKLAATDRLLLALQADSFAHKANWAALQLRSSKVIASIYMEMDSTAKAINALSQMADCAAIIADTTSLGIAYNNLGTIYNQKSDYGSALIYYRKAMDLFIALGDRKRVAECLINIGIVHKIQGDFDRAFEITVSAAGILDSLGATKQLSSAYTTLGNVLNELNRPDEALQYLARALKIKTDADDAHGMAGVLNSIGNIHRKKQDYDTALVYYNKALEIKERFHLTKGIGTTINNIAETYFALSKYDIAEAYFKRGLALRNATEDKEGVITSLNRLTALYLKRNETDKAEVTAQRAFAMMPPSGLLKQKTENTLSLAEVFRRKRQYEKASDFVSKGIALKDSLFNSEMAEEVLQLSVKYKTKEKDKELLMAKRLQTAQAQEIKLQRYFIGLLVLVLVLLCVLALLLYRSAVYRKKAKVKVEILMAELKHRVKNNLQIMSDMLNLQISASSNHEEIATTTAIRNRIQSMSILHSLLQKDAYNGAVDMADFFQSLLTNLSHAYEDVSDRFDMLIEVADIKLHSNKAIPLGLIVNELVTNIYKYANVSGSAPRIELKLSEENNYCKVYIADNCGYWEAKQNHGPTSGFGTVLVEMLIQQLGAKHETTINETGTEHTILFILEE